MRDHGDPIEKWASLNTSEQGQSVWARIKMSGATTLGKNENVGSNNAGQELNAGSTNEVREIYYRMGLLSIEKEREFGDLEWLSSKE